MQEEHDELRKSIENLQTQLPGYYRFKTVATSSELLAFEEKFHVTRTNLWVESAQSSEDK